jgi:hypothetical protein
MSLRTDLALDGRDAPRHLEPVEQRLARAFEDRPGNHRGLAGAQAAGVAPRAERQPAPPQCGQAKPDGQRSRVR